MLSCSLLRYRNLTQQHDCEDNLKTQRALYVKSMTHSANAEKGLFGKCSSGSHRRRLGE